MWKRNILIHNLQGNTKSMKKIFLYQLLFLIFYTMSCGQITECNISPSMGDVTAEIQSIGNIPSNQGMEDRARNIWDLQTFQNRIHIGFGNTTTNAGPIGLWSVDSNNNFDFEKSIKGEAIERIRVYDDNLYFPNSDPLGGISDLRKFSRKTNTNIWEDYEWYPSLAHTRDMIYFNLAYVNLL